MAEWHKLCPLAGLEMILLYGADAFLPASSAYCITGR